MLFSFEFRTIVMLGFAQTHQELCPWTPPPYEKGGHKLFSRYTICSGWNTSSKRSAVRKPSATQASFKEIFS